MPEQLTFWTPASRRADPVTSIAAAREHGSSGRAGTHGALVLEEVRREPGRTYRQLAAACGLEPTEVMRRLGDLQRAAHVRKGAPRRHDGDGHLMSTWWPRYG